MGQHTSTMASMSTATRPAGERCRILGDTARTAGSDGRGWSARVLHELSATRPRVAPKVVRDRASGGMPAIGAAGDQGRRFTV